jgi:hypothetical protein
VNGWWVRARRNRTPEPQVTERGFTIYAKFLDSYGNMISVQESSSAAGPRCWVFSDGETLPHLSVDQARHEVLLAWISASGVWPLPPLPPVPHEGIWF